MKRPRQTAQPQSRPGGPGKGHAASLLGVYDRAARPGRMLPLIIEGHGATGPELKFLPLAPTGDSAGCVGLLETSTGYQLRATRLRVVAPGDRDDHAASLVVAGKLPRRLAAEPGAVLRGLAKSVVRAYTDLAPAAEPALRWQAALLLALDGELRTGQLAGFGLDVAELATAAGVFEPGEDRVVWLPHAERLAAKLELRAAELARRNPFATRLTASAAVALLGRASPELTGRALSIAAKRQGWAATALCGEPACVLREQNVARESDRQTAAKMLSFVADGEGGLEQLRERFKTSGHVAAWLLEAGLLVRSPDGFLFTGDELDRYWDQLKLDSAKEVPGVGEIKERLGLVRRKAEGLRSLLLERHGEPGRQAAAGEGQ